MNHWWKLGLLTAVIFIAAAALHAAGLVPGDFTPESVKTLVTRFGLWAPAIYLGAYSQPIVPLPASVMTLAGGLAFGPIWGTAAAVTGATVRAAAQFGIARLMGRDAVARLLHGRIAHLDRRIGENGFYTVLVIRMIPNLPYDMQNYGFGFSQVRFLPYALATFAGILPGTFAFAYFGHSLSEPGNLWKLILAVALILALVAAQHIWLRRKPLPAAIVTEDYVPESEHAAR